MPAPDPRAPLIAGVAQLSDHDGELSPLQLMAETARVALLDAGADAGPILSSRLGVISVPYAFTWPVPDPARALAQELGVTGVETVRSASGGTAPIHLLAHACDLIADGHADVVLISGGEAVRLLMDAMAAGGETGWPTQPDETVPDRYVGVDRDPGHPAEAEAGLIAPVNYYPWFEEAVRASSGRSPEDHQIWLGELWAKFSAVAPANPHAWTQRAYSADEIVTAGPDNRPAVYPYTKLMTANIQVNQGASVVLCSQSVADEAGVASERRVFVRAAAAANDHWFAIERDRLDRSPAVAACGREVLLHGDLAIDEVDHLDIYSCFPSAVQIAAAELGIDLAEDERSPTVTGGLTCAGGPANNYCTHSLAAMVERIRERGGSGLVTGVGWYMTKHAMALLSATPPEVAFEAFDLQAQVDALPKREVAEEFSGAAAIEAYTAVYDRDGVATMGVVSCVVDDGARVVANTFDQDVAAELVNGDPLGAEVELTGGRFAL